MRRVAVILITLFVAASSRGADEKITYQQHVKPIFNTSCVTCHNPDKNQAGLDLTTYAATMKGSSGPVIQPGDPDSSLVYLLVTHQEEPHMPLKASKLPDAQLETIRKWIAGGALDAADSVAAALNKPKMELKLAAAPSGRPAVIPMPANLPLEPITRSERPAASGAIAASPWAPLLAVSSPHQVLLYHAQSLELLGVLAFADGLPKTLRFSRSGALLLAGGGVGGQSGHALLYDVSTGKQVATVGEEYDEVLAADISPDQSTVALGGPAKLLKIFSVADNKLLHKLTPHTDWVTAVAYSPDGVLLASGDRNGGLRVWEAGTAAEFYTLTGHKAAITRLSFRADSNVLASSSDDGTVKLWDMNSGTEIKSWPAHGSGTTCVDFAPDGRLVTCGRDQVVRLWDAVGTKLLDLQPLRDIALHVVFANEGTTIVAADLAGQVRVSAAADGKQTGETDTNPPMIAERIVEARKKLAEAEAVTAKTAAELTSAQGAATKATVELQAAQANVATMQKAVETAQAKVTELTAASQAATAEVEVARKAASIREAERDRLTSITKATTQPTTQQTAAAAAAADALTTAQHDHATKQAVAQKAAGELAAASAALPKAQADLATANAAIQQYANQAAATETARVKAEQAANAAGAQLAAARAELNKWKLADVSAQLAKAEKELESLSGVKDELARALAQLEAANKTLAEGPQRVTAAEQRVAKAKEVHAAAVLAQQKATAVAAERELVVQQLAQSARAVEPATTRPSTDPSIVNASAKLKEALDLLKPGLDQLRISATQAADAATKAAAEATAAAASLATAKSELAAAPEQLEQARKQISESVAERIQAATDHVDRLRAEKHRLESPP